MWARIASAASLQIAAIDRVAQSHRDNTGLLREASWIRPWSFVKRVFTPSSREIGGILEILCRKAISATDLG